MVAKITPELAKQDSYKFGFNDNDNATYSYRTEKGLSEDIVREISRVKNEPQWMTDFRVRSYRHFLQKPMPTGFWGGSIQNYNLDFNDIYYFARASDRSEQDWSDVPEYIKDTFDKLGIPEAEKKSLIAGVGAQYDSEVVYHSIRADLEKLGVIFTDTDSAVRDYPELFRKYFGTIVPPADNKFAALNSAVWSGGSFVYVPAGVKVDIPLQAYFRINKENMGQFERTLIIAEEGSYVHYVEGCTAPTYSTDALHSAVVEIVVKKNARVRYTTIQNWSTNVYNLVTKRAAAYENAVMEWVDGNLGSRLTMKYPSVYLMEPGAHGEVLSLAMASTGQHQDAGAKMVHAAPNTTSTIISKSVSRGSGRTSYRGALKVYPGAQGSRATVRCDALLIDKESRSDTYPMMEIEEEQVTIGHEASVSRVGEDQLFYLQSRGLTEVDATKMIVNGFVEPIVKELPMEYAVELNRLIELQMEGAVG
ncbi:MAG: Fe-S cluster assembly protein SufB [Chloroflexota bacterium]|nr:Fe-S cluster assembly protein SufB [Chloroflexota bacterium]